MLNSPKAISIGSDHAGYDLKSKLIVKLQAAGYALTDRGAYAADSVDYPDHARPVAQDVVAGNVTGILICGSGNGVCMTANKYAEVRAALCWTEELAALARQHNDANILCIPARFVSEAVAFGMVDVFLNTVFEGGRHLHRVKKISC